VFQLRYDARRWAENANQINGRRRPRVQPQTLVASAPSIGVELVRDAVAPVEAVTERLGVANEVAAALGPGFPAGE
jgi:hypothetical protein